MTKEDWQRVETALHALHNPVVLLCDGYEVNLVLRPVAQFKNAIMVHVNGWFRGEWLVHGSDEAVRFYPLHKRLAHNTESRKRYRALSKAARDILKWDMEQCITWRGHYWTSFRSLKAHFIKHNRSIEIKEIGFDLGS